MAKKAMQVNLDPPKAQIIEMYANDLYRSVSDTLRLIVDDYISSKHLSEKYNIKLSK